MPSQILHSLFIEDVINALPSIPGAPKPEILYKKHRKVMNLAAQGPDVFYHNQRTFPSALRFGRVIHRANYGKLVAEMTRMALSRGEGWQKSEAFEETAAFILGFSTHALLDRETHPYIIFFAGDCYQCHPFFERILDVVMYKRLRSRNVSELDFTLWFPLEAFLSEGNPQGRLPLYLEDILLKAINDTFRSRLHPLRIPELRNAVGDALSFYSWTNPKTAKSIRVLAFIRDREENGGRRRLALFHPEGELPDQDYLNLDGREWFNPFTGESENRQSFVRLYDRALFKARLALAALYRCLWGGEDPQVLEGELGNDNLNGKPVNIAAEGAHKQVCADNFALSAILDSMYQNLAAAYPNL